MSNPQNDPLSQAKTTCGLLLYELQIIWDEVGEAEHDRDRILFELEQGCLEVYRRKVDQANRSRAQLRQTIADCEAELGAIYLVMGKCPIHIKQSNRNTGSLKEEHARILPQLEEMKKHHIEPRNPEAYFGQKRDFLKNKFRLDFVREKRRIEDGICQ